MRYQPIRTIPSMTGCRVEVAVTPDGREVVRKRALTPAAATSLAQYVRQVRSLQGLPGIAGYYPPLLAYADDTVILPCYSRGTLDSAGDRPRSTFRRLVSEAVDCLFAISGHRDFPAEPSAPAPLAVARLFWRSQLSRRLDRLTRAGIDPGGEPFRSISRALSDGLVDRILARAVNRPLGLAAHGDFGLNNVLLADPAEAGPLFRFIDLRGDTVWSGGLPWWDPILDLATLVAFHELIEPALGVREGIALGPDHGLAVLSRGELIEDALTRPAVRRWVAGDPAWRLRTQLGIVVRLLGSVSAQRMSAPTDRAARAGIVTELLAHEWRVLLSC